MRFSRSQSFASVLIAFYFAYVSASALAQTVPGPGDTAPPISIDALTNAPDGIQASWETLSSGTTVIEFWGTWCAPCVAAIPHLNELHDHFAPKGVNFLSVTFEEPSVTNRFQERKKVNTWIGHDMDRSMVKDYAVRGWPTTFVIRDGTIIARTSPSALTKERLSIIVQGKDDPNPDPATRAMSATPATSLGPDGRPSVSDSIKPGVDPFSPIKDQPALQIIVRPAGDLSSTASSGMALTALGANIVSIVQSTYHASSYAIEADPKLTDQKFDVIYRIPRDQYPALMPTVRELINTGLGIRVENEMREIDGYELRIAETGLKLMDSGVDRQLGISSMTNGTSTTITSASGKLATVAGFVASIMGAPVVNRTDHEAYVFLDLELPADKDKLSDVLLEEAGLVLVPTKHEIEFTIIKPAE